MCGTPTVIALLLLYINNQNAEITTDTLTGLFKPAAGVRVFRTVLWREREKEGVKSIVAVVVLDINSFKGHQRPVRAHYGGRGDYHGRALSGNRVPMG